MVVSWFVFAEMLIGCLSISRYKDESNSNSMFRHSASWLQIPSFAGFVATIGNTVDPTRRRQRLPKSTTRSPATRNAGLFQFRTQETEGFDRIVKVDLEGRGNSRSSRVQTKRDHIMSKQENNKAIAGRWFTDFSS